MKKKIKIKMKRNKKLKIVDLTHRFEFGRKKIDHHHQLRDEIQRKDFFSNV